MADEARGANAVDGFDAVIQCDDADAVMRATPRAMHASQTRAALAAGKHVQVEIPMADSLADAEATLAALEAQETVATAMGTRAASIRRTSSCTTASCG